MDFTIPARSEHLRRRVVAFVDRELLPLEVDLSTYDPHGDIVEAPPARQRGLARAGGLWCLQLKPETGGGGLDEVGTAVCRDEINRSIWRPVVFNSAAPDDGNMTPLEAVGTPAWKERGLRPIVEGPRALRLGHDRARTGRRLRSRDDPYGRAPARGRRPRPRRRGRLSRAGAMGTLFDLSGTHGSVTGASSGLGRPLARRMVGGRGGSIVDALAPGCIETELDDGFLATDAGRALVRHPPQRRLPQRRLGRLSELDGPLPLLASGPGSFMTGRVISVDGGHLRSSL